MTQAEIKFILDSTISIAKLEINLENLRAKRDEDFQRLEAIEGRLIDMEKRLSLLEDHSKRNQARSSEFRTNRTALIVAIVSLIGTVTTGLLAFWKR